MHHKNLLSTALSENTIVPVRLTYLSKKIYLASNIRNIYSKKVLNLQNTPPLYPTVVNIKKTLEYSAAPERYKISNKITGSIKLNQHFWHIVYWFSFQTFPEENSQYQTKRIHKLVLSFIALKRVERDKIWNHNFLASFIHKLLKTTVNHTFWTLYFYQKFVLHETDSLD